MADQAERRVDDRAVQEVKNSGLELAKRVRKSNYPESKSLCEWAERARVVANGVSGTRGKDIANALEFLQSETASCLTALNDPQAFQPACMRGQVLALTRTQMGEMAARLAEAVSRVRNAADISRGRQEAMEEARKLASEAERRMAERFDEGLTSLGESIRQKSEEETDRVVQQLSKADKNIRQVVEGEAQDVRQTVEGEVRDTLTAAERAYSSAISSVASKEAMVAKTAERLASSKGQGDQGNKGCEKHQQKEQSNHPDPHPPTDPNPDPAPEPEPPKPKGKATAKAQPTGASVGTSEPQRGNQAEPFEFDDEEADGFAARPEAAGAPSTRQARRNGKTQSEQATQKGYGTGVGASTVGAKTAEEIARREATKSAHPRAAEMVNELLGKPLMNRRRNRRTTWEEAKARGWSEVDLSGMEVPGADITVRKRPEEKGLDPPLTRALASALTACACLERLSLSGCLLEDAGEAAVDDLLSSLASHSCLHCIAFGGSVNCSPMRGKVVGILGECHSLRECDGDRGCLRADNSLGDQGARIIANKLQHCKELQFLGLQANEIGREGALALANAMELHSSLQTVDLTWNVITTEVCEHLKARFSGGKLEVKLKMQQGERASSGYE